MLWPRNLFKSLSWLVFLLHAICVLQGLGCKATALLLSACSSTTDIWLDEPSFTSQTSISLPSMSPSEGIPVFSCSWNCRAFLLVISVLQLCNQHVRPTEWLLLGLNNSFGRLLAWWWWMGCWTRPNTWPHSSSSNWTHCLIVFGNNTKPNP